MHYFKLGILFFLMSNFAYSQTKLLKEHILFYCSFDGQTSAEIAVGDPLLYNAENYKKTDEAKVGLHNPNVLLAKGKGLTGDALYFKKQNTSAIYFNGYKNLGYSATSWTGSFSFWLRLDPETDLAPGYCDPINLTDAKFNDAALWVDFTDDKPRVFRLGVLGDLEVWNPENKNDKAALEKRLVNVKQAPFKSEEWTHIVITYSEINTNRAVTKLYINGNLQGQVKDVNDPFTWEEEKAKIMLGLGYVGMMDELAVFDKALDLEEVEAVYKLNGGIKTLFK